MEKKDILMQKILTDTTDLEKEVLRSLGRDGPMSGYDFHLGGKQRGERRPSMVPTSWLTIKKRLSPTGLNLIEPVVKHGRPPLPDPLSPPDRSFDRLGRRRNPYWLTEKGIVYALVYGVKPNTLSKWVEKLISSPKNEPLITLLELVQVVGIDCALEFYSECKELGMTKSLERALRFLPLSKDKTRKIFEISKKHPNLVNLSKMRIAAKEAVDELFKDLETT